MFFTRTIRRKMVLGLALVLTMLLMLSISGMSGLISLGNLVNDLNFSLNKAPQRAELADAVELLLEPFSYAPIDPEGARFQKQQFLEQLELAKEKVIDFHTKLEAMPPTLGNRERRWVVKPLVFEVHRQFDELEQDGQLLGNIQQRGALADKMLRQVAKLHSQVQKAPDPQEGLNGTLAHARRVYSSRFWMVSVLSAVVVVLFLGLVRYGYLWIFLPIRKLHEGARRVAQGDFKYRVELTSHDEMAELADAFNKMTARFREITEDLDRQVRERCNQLVRSERLAGVGFLSAGVAHEINNPLSAIVMASDSLRERTTELLADSDSEDAAVIRQYLEMIVREAQRCREITAKLLDFSRGEDATRGENDLTALISEVLSMVQHMSKFRDRGIEFTRSEPCYLEVNGPEIKQVVLNLVANALESMDAGGTLRIDVTEQTDHVLMTFQDDGCGMTPEVIEHLFEPFFTQRRTGKGTGLGLSISHRIISDHGGMIEATSAGPRQGSTFRIHLPRKAANSDVAA